MTYKTRTKNVNKKNHIYSGNERDRFNTILYTRVGPYLHWNDFNTAMLVSTVAAWS